MNTKRKKDAWLLKSVLERVLSGALPKDDLLDNNRMSQQKLRGHGVKSSLNSIISDPELFRRYAQLKRAVERWAAPIPRTGVQKRYSGLIARIKAVLGPSGNVVDLSRNHKSLYREALACPHWPLVKGLAISTKKRPEYFHWTDNDLIEAAGEYVNFTELKHKDGSLHRMITGRELKDKVRLRWSSYNTHCYVGLNGQVYRSQGELVFGNLICLSGVRNDWVIEAPTNVYRPESNKPMTADFLCKPIEHFIELSMFEADGRGARGKQYVDRRDQKASVYDDNHIYATFINTSTYYAHGCIDARAFAQHCIDVMVPLGYHGLSKAKLESSKLCYWEGVDCRPDLSASDYLDYLEQKYELTMKSQLSVDKSFLLPPINLRDDAQIVKNMLAERGKRIRKWKIAQRVAKRVYATVNHARQYAAKYGIKSQPEWHAHTKAHREELQRLGIPANVQHVYGRLGQWKGWTYFFELARKAAT